MDIIDQEIINLLKKDSRMTASSISKKVNLSIPAVTERINKLDKLNIITNYTIKLNRKKLGYKLIAFICVVLEQAADIQYFRNEILKLNSVMECHHVAGQYDYILKICVRDTDDLENFLMNHLKKIKGVASSNTLISLSVLKEDVNI